MWEPLPGVFSWRNPQILYLPPSLCPAGCSHSAANQTQTREPSLCSRRAGGLSVLVAGQFRTTSEHQLTGRCEAELDRDNAPLGRCDVEHFQPSTDDLITSSVLQSWTGAWSSPRSRWCVGRCWKPWFISTRSRSSTGTSRRETSC